MKEKSRDRIMHTPGHKQEWRPNGLLIAAGGALALLICVATYFSLFSIQKAQAKTPANK